LPSPTPLDELNAEQRQAVLHGAGDPAGGPPLLVIAGAGSGKTNTLAHRVAHLVAEGADARRILLLTFSRRAAIEMTRRVERISGERALPWAGTFHGIGARLLREFAGRVGLDDGFSIHDREDSADLMAMVRHDLGLSQTETRFPAKATCLSIYSRAVNAGEDLEAVLARHFPWCAGWQAELQQLFADYVDAKQRQQVLDYDDLLLYWAEMMTVRDIADTLGARFSHVLVDEYQDTNRLQARILLGLRPDGRGVTVVGDDAQSIYAFRAATVRNILEFPAHFDPPARVVTLERNYRSTQPILDAANAVIGLAAERFTKNLWTDRASAAKPRLVTVRDEVDQARYVVEQVLANREAGAALKQQAVLFRTSHHAGTLEIELMRHNIPYVKFGGLKFLDAAHVKDLLALLRWVQNPRDRVAGFRVLTLIDGVGPVSAARLLDHLAASPDLRWALDTVAVPPRGAAGWSGLRDLLARRANWPVEIEMARAWYEPQLERAHEDAAVRKADLIQLQQIAAGYASRERFLTELTLDPPDATSDEAGVPHKDEDYLILSTIHSAKGQEWRAVYMLNVVDGCMPSDLGTGETEALEEERRLLYVGMTRARDDLHLLVPQRFFTHNQAPGGDRHVYAARTRFIPTGLLPLFELASWPVAVPSEGPRAAGPAVDIGARLRRRWQAPHSVQDDFDLASLGD